MFLSKEKNWLDLHNINIIFFLYFCFHFHFLLKQQFWVGSRLWSEISSNWYLITNQIPITFFYSQCKEKLPQKWLKAIKYATGKIFIKSVLVIYIQLQKKSCSKLEIFLNINHTFIYTTQSFKKLLLLWS